MFFLLLFISFISLAEDNCRDLLAPAAYRNIYGQLDHNKGQLSAQRGKRDYFSILANSQRAFLTGEIKVSKAKNSALKLVVAAALKEGKTVFYDLPKLRDMETLYALMEKMGITILHEGNKTTIDATTINTNRLDCELVSSMRASILFFGTLLARTGGSLVSMPGGCDIGARKVDFHIAGAKEKGFDVHHHDALDGHLVASTPEKIPGTAHYRQPFASVGAMENLIVASVIGKQTFTLDNSALEPEIEDLLRFLQAMGANIEIKARRTVIKGVQQSDLKEIAYTPIGDRIEAISYITAALYKNSRLRVSGFNPNHIKETLQVFRRMGAKFIIQENTVVVLPHSGLRATNFSTNPSPGIPTDAQSLILWLMTKAKGTSIVEENVYESRIKGFAAYLNSMGAQIRYYSNKAFVVGNPKQVLTAKKGQCLDLRAGMAALLALLNAKGPGKLTGIDKIDRGYADVEKKLDAIGCRFKRVSHE